MLEVYEAEYIINIYEEVEVFRDLEHGWFLSDDKTVEEKINKVIEALNENKFEIKEYPRIISLFIELEHAGFSGEIVENMISAMKSDVKKLNKRVSIGEDYSMMKDGEKRKRCKEILADIQKEMDQYFQIHVSDIMESYLEKEDRWAEALYDYVTKNRAELSNVDGFLSRYDISELTEKIENSKSYDIRAFRGCILILYVNSAIGNALKSEREKLVELKDRIEKMDKSGFDKIKSMQIGYLISNLQRAIEQYEGNGE